MGMFGGRDKKREPESVQEAPPKKEAATWDDGMLSALPKSANFFDALRTDAFMNHNTVENFVEFWAALKVNEAEDKWRVMHYMIYDLDQKDGKFVSEQTTKHDVSFPEAIAAIAKQEYIAEKMMTHKELDLAATYAPEKFPELKVHFFDLEHYKRGANIEGIAFDDMNQPYRRVEGRIFANATFKRSEVVKSILAIEQAKDVPSVNAKIEGGILSDIFATASDRAASFDNILKIGQVLSAMDEFASQVGAFYLSIQRAINKDDKFDRIEGLQPEEKAEVLSHAEGLTPVRKNDAKPFPKIIENLIPQMNAQLETAKSLGVHVEPFQKFAAECELYANLLYASQNLAKLEKGFVSVNNSDSNLITQIRESVDKAQRKFLDLGGTQEQMDKLKAWVANPKKDPIPNWLPGFLTRYYESRGKVMQKVQDRQAGVSQVNTMSVDVKPPVTDQYNDASAKPPSAAAPGMLDSSNDNKGSQGPDFDKFKNVMGSSRPKPTGGQP